MTTGKQLDLIEDATTPRKRVVLVTDGEPVVKRRAVLNPTDMTLQGSHDGKTWADIKGPAEAQLVRVVEKVPSDHALDAVRFTVDPNGDWKAQERMTGYTEWVDLHTERPPCSGVWEFGGYGLGSGLKGDRRIILPFPDRWFYDKDSDMWYAPYIPKETGRFLPMQPWNSGLFPPETFWRGLKAPWWLGYTYHGVPAPAEYVGKARVKLLA